MEPGLLLRAESDSYVLAAAVSSGSGFLTRDFGYAVYTEDFGGAQEGIIDVAPAPYEVR